MTDKQFWELVYRGLCLIMSAIRKRFDIGEN